MYQEDFLLRQINQLARALGKLIFNMMGIKNSGQIAEFYGVANESLKNELNYDLNELLLIADEQFVQNLMSINGMNNDNLEKLADLIFTIADVDRNQNSMKWFKKCLLIYSYLDQHDQTFSFERASKIKILKSWVL
jgi:hypothetical protein